MSIVEILLIAVGLAMDAFAVSVAAAASGRARGRWSTFRLSFHFGLFQAVMPVAGWYAGTRVAPLIEAADHWVAFGLLALVGAHMIREGCTRGDLDVPRAGDPSRGWSLVVLSVATSIDALAVGLGLAMLQVDIWLPAAVIGLVTAALSLVGVVAGRRLGASFGRRAAVAGGVILIGIGVKILIEHLAL